MSKHTVREVADTLATDHKREDIAAEIWLSEDDREVRLVEVSPSINNAHEVLPFRFAARPDLGIDYPSTVVLLSPEEWLAVLAGTLHLPQGWEPAKLKRIA